MLSLAAWLVQYRPVSLSSTDLPACTVQTCRLVQYRPAGLSSTDLSACPLQTCRLVRYRPVSLYSTLKLGYLELQGTFKKFES